MLFFIGLTHISWVLIFFIDIPDSDIKTLYILHYF